MQSLFIETSRFETLVFTVGLRVEDDHGHDGGRVEGFGDQLQLFGGGEGGGERRQLFEGHVGRQGGVQGQHGREDAVGQETFWLTTENKQRKNDIHPHPN